MIGRGGAFSKTDSEGEEHRNSRTMERLRIITRTDCFSAFMPWHCVEPEVARELNKYFCRKSEGSISNVNTQRLLPFQLGYRKQEELTVPPEEGRPTGSHMLLCVEFHYLFLCCTTCRS
jgi:hypothetical protein